MSSLTVFSRISNRDFRFWAVAIIIYCLNLDLIGHVGRSSGHKKLGNVGHSAWGPILIHVLLSPLYFVLQTGPVGLKSCQHLYREYFFVTWWKKIHKNIPTVCQAFTLLRYICFKKKQWEIGSQHSAHSNKWFQIFQNDGLPSRRWLSCQALFLILEHLEDFHQELGKPKHDGSVSEYFTYILNMYK